MHFTSISYDVTEYLRLKDTSQLQGNRKFQLETHESILRLKLTITMSFLF